MRLLSIETNRENLERFADPKEYWTPNVTPLPSLRAIVVNPPLFHGALHVNRKCRFKERHRFAIGGPALFDVAALPACNSWR
jgi:hypothetical protein